MTRRNHDMETLNAYLDGELTGFRAAALERELAHNSDLARQVSDLKALKSKVGIAYGDLEFRWPDLDTLFAARGRKPRRQGLKPGARWWLPSLGLWPGLAIGATAAALVAVLLLGWLTLRPVPDAMMAEAVSLHHQWLRETGKTGDSGRAQLAIFKAVNGDIYIPDLAASKLRIAKAVPFGRNGVQVGYRGTRDCHISLFVQPADVLGDLPLVRQQLGDSQTYRWRVNQFDYVLVAVGIDQTRLHLIATDVFHAARLGVPFDRKTRLALNLNRRSSQPCAV